MADVQRGELLKKMREEAGYSQAEVGRLVGVTKQSVSAWEAGGRPDLVNLGKLDLLYKRSGGVLALFGIEQRDEVRRLRQDVDRLEHLAIVAAELLLAVDGRTPRSAHPERRAELLALFPHLR